MKRKLKSKKLSFELDTKPQLKILFKKERKVKRKRKSLINYNKIKNNNRRKLIEMVTFQEIPLRKASEILGINYSTAKTIVRIFTLENRTDKKNSIDENEIRKTFSNLKKEKLNINLRKYIYLSLAALTITSTFSEEVEKLNKKIRNAQNNINCCLESVKNSHRILQNIIPFNMFQGYLRNFIDIESK